MPCSSALSLLVLVGSQQITLERLPLVVSALLWMQP